MSLYILKNARGLFTDEVEAFGKSRNEHHGKSRRKASTFELRFLHHFGDWNRLRLGFSVVLPGMTGRYDWLNRGPLWFWSMCINRLNGQSITVPITSVVSYKNMKLKEATNRSSSHPYALGVSLITVCKGILI